MTKTIFALIGFALVPSHLIASCKSYSGNDYGQAAICQKLTEISLNVDSSFSQKTIAQMGDRAALAILKIFSDAELRNPETANSFLPILSQAFSAPDAIRNSDDKDPRFTLILIERLRTSVGTGLASGFGDLQMRLTKTRRASTH